MKDNKITYESAGVNLLASEKIKGRIKDLADKEISRFPPGYYWKYQDNKTEYKWHTKHIIRKTIR